MYQKRERGGEGGQVDKFTPPLHEPTLLFPQNGICQGLDIPLTLTASFGKWRKEQVSCPSGTQGRHWQSIDGRAWSRWWAASQQLQTQLGLEMSGGTTGATVSGCIRWQGVADKTGKDRGAQRRHGIGGIVCWRSTEPHGRLRLLEPLSH